MRAILTILIVAVIALIGAIALGLVDFTQTRGATAPTLETDNGAIRARAGQTPAFEVQTGTVAVGTRSATVPVPRVEVSRDKAQVQVPSVEVRRPAEPQPGNTAP